MAVPDTIYFNRMKYFDLVFDECSRLNDALEEDF